MGVGGGLPVSILHAELGEEVTDVVCMRDVLLGFRVTYESPSKVASRCAETLYGILCCERSDKGVDKGRLEGLHC